MADGFNPMRWNCENQGCFNKVKRPKIEVFHDCFPSKISFGDVDGIVEINGNALMLEWKSDWLGGLPTGQRIMYERLTKNNKITVICVVGDAQTMNVFKYGLFVDGKFTGWQDSNLDGVKDFIRNWAIEAKRNITKVWLVD